MSYMWAVLPLGLLYALSAGSLAMAQSPSAQSAAAGATTGLGKSHRFATLDAAAAHCPGDTVVWSDGRSLTYHLSAEPAGYSHGFFACKMEADSAGFTAAP
jgi:hypothetical protein